MDRRHFVGLAGIGVMSPFLRPVAYAQPIVRAKIFILRTGPPRLVFIRLFASSAGLRWKMVRQKTGTVMP